MIVFFTLDNGRDKQPGAVKLYDLSKDIAEKNDLAAQHPDIAKQISDIMAEAWVAPRSQQDDGRYPAPRGAQEK